jgi:hypothetical protein
MEKRDEEVVEEAEAKKEREGVLKDEGLENEENKEEVSLRLDPETRRRPKPNIVCC